MKTILIIANVFNDAMRIVKGKIFHGKEMFGKCQATVCWQSQQTGKGHSLSSPVATAASVKSDKPPVNFGGKSLSGATWRVLSKIEEWCALQVLNLRPPVCDTGALPLS